MKFDNAIKSLLEDFNVYPKSQMAVSAGPDQGMTSGDIANTFPSKQETLRVKLPKKKIKKLRKD